MLEGVEGALGAMWWRREEVLERSRTSGYDTRARYLLGGRRSTGPAGGVNVCRPGQAESDTT
jgi:hypothetical protein